MSSVFSDWGAAAWTEDLDAARDQALDELDRTADARGWTDYYRGSVEALIGAAYTDADGWLGDDVPAFWASVAGGMRSLSTSWSAAGVAVPSGWDKLATAWSSASGASATVAEGREAGSIATVASGTAAASADELGDIAEAGLDAAGGAVRLFKHPAAWVAAAVVVVLVVSPEARRAVGLR